MQEVEKVDISKAYENLETSVYHGNCLDGYDFIQWFCCTSLTQTLWNDGILYKWMFVTE